MKHFFSRGLLLLAATAACTHSADPIQPTPDYVEDGPCSVLPDPGPLGWQHEPHTLFRQQPALNPTNAEEVAYVAFVTDTMGIDRSGLYKESLRTRQVTRLNQSATYNRLHWSSRGDLLFLNQGRLWRITATGDSLRQVPGLPGSIGTFALSPDGRQLAYTVAGGTYQAAALWLTPLAGGTPRLLATPGYWPQLTLAWAADGQRLAFGAYPVGTGATPNLPHTLCTLHVGTGTFAAAPAPLPFPVQSLQWHPNGTDVFWAGGRHLYREPLANGAARQQLREGCQTRSFQSVGPVPGQPRLLVLRINSSAPTPGLLKQETVLETMSYDGQQVLQVSP
ncbi:TolB family protein [Hymenobacter psychrotolerans]|uniref:WD40-like Beta Propeller Repeat n=1 Tax=Hymenobacter psychrotolerans DSM 18569 TaxID=1121959 RepID=A0A1M6TIG2_9BACT|nr:PD40 domain-containing protein [Hymenobacter psychrotolerans]SHK56704.1 WD40-like Beta Propeller Repeat [Hymenobacter psychrotolerans DSM 18569]